MKDEPIDIIPFIILLGLVVSLSLGITMPMYRKALSIETDEVYDKTVADQTGAMYEKNNSSILPGYSYAEMVLYIANQSYFMPVPRVIDIGGEVVSIQAEAEEMKDPNASYTVKESEDYIPENYATLYRCQNMLNKWCSAYTTLHHSDGHKLRFTIRFTTGDIENQSDDCYSLYVIGRDTTDKNEEDIYFRCLENGRTELDLMSGSSKLALLTT